MKYTVVIKQKVSKNVRKLPLDIQKQFVQLIKDLTEKGYEHSNWPNYSELSKDKYHCHLSRRWIACWSHEKNTIIIEVYYAGSRENAPY